MSKTHYYIIAALAGVAIGFYYLGTSATTNATLSSIYTSGQTAG